MASRTLILDGPLRPYPESPDFVVPLTREVESVSQHHVICFSPLSEAEGMAACSEHQPHGIVVQLCPPCSFVGVLSHQLLYRCTKEGTSPHSIWTCSRAYGSRPREKAPIWSWSWACLAHSQPPRTFGWFINQPLPTIPAHWPIHV